MSRLDFSKKIQKHDWFYAYSDDNRWFTAGQLERKEINHLQAVLGCPFSLDKLFKWANRMIIEEFLEESKSHGWPSFRDDEVNWDNVEELWNGEIVSKNGTHLGHNLPDTQGNRHCINLVSIAGNQPR